jgi:hypothetical protein
MKACHQHEGDPSGEGLHLGEEKMGGGCKNLAKEER